MKLVVLAGFFVVGCSKSGPGPKNTEPAPTEPEVSCPEGATPVSSDGAQDDCIVANGCCYSTAEAACAAISCPEEQCVMMETFPPQAGCQASEVEPDADVSDADEPTSN